MNYKRLYHSFIIILACLIPATVVLAAQPDSIVITWPLRADAVSYELEITDQYFPAGDSIAPASHVIVTSASFTVGTELSGAFLHKINKLWWRVRALDVQSKPITAFSES